MSIFDDVFKWLSARVDRRPEPFQWSNPSGDHGVAVVYDEGQSLHVLSVPEKKPKAEFARVQCADAASLASYLQRHAITSRSIVFANEGGLFAVMDYCEPGDWMARVDGADVAVPILDKPGLSLRRAEMVAQWSPECAAAMKQLGEHAGKWISLDAMESFLDVAAPFIRDVATVRDVLLDLDGAELVSAKRTKTGSELQIGTNVQAKDDRKIPGSLRFVARFMGGTVEMESPLRVRIQNRAIQFLIVDNGAIRKAKMEAVSMAAQAIRADGWFVVEGSLQ